MADRSEFDNDIRRALFSADAEAYLDGRPGYPAEVFDHLRASCGLGPGCRVLEVGPGPGQATGPLLDAGASVVAVELGAEFVAGLRDRHAGRKFEVRQGAFETVDVEPASFDLVAAATSFHWVPPELGLHRAADALRPGGSIALWWNHYGDPDRPDPFREAVQPLLHEHAPHLADSAEHGGAGIGAHPYALDRQSRIDEFAAIDRFGPVEITNVSWTATHTSAAVVGLLRSISHWMALGAAVRTELLRAIEELVDADFGGAVERPFRTAIYSAKRL